MLPILGIVISLASIACWIYVEVKVFQSGNILMGILGICPLVAFIYGWVKSSELDIQKVMLAWTVLWIVGIIVNVTIRSQMGTAP